MDLISISWFVELKKNWVNWTFDTISEIPEPTSPLGSPSASWDKATEKGQTEQQSLDRNEIKKWEYWNKNANSEQISGSSRPYRSMWWYRTGPKLGPKFNFLSVVVDVVAVETMRIRLYLNESHVSLWMKTQLLCRRPEVFQFRPSICRPVKQKLICW